MYQIIKKAFLISFIILVGSLFFTSKSFADNFQLTVNCPVGVDCNGWMVCANLGNELDPTFATTVRNNTAVISVDNRGEIRGGIAVVHGLNGERNYGKQINFNTTGRLIERGATVFIEDNFNGPYCENIVPNNSPQPGNHLVEMISDLRERGQACLQRLDFQCYVRTQFQILETIAGYLSPESNQYNPREEVGNAAGGQVEDEHPFMQIYQFAKAEECITCHSFQGKEDVENNDQTIREDDQLRSRILQVRNMPQHNLTPEQLINPDNCMGCHSAGPRVAYGRSGNGLAEDRNDVHDWMAPPNREAADFFGDSPNEMCTGMLIAFQMMDNFDFDRRQLVEDLEHHFKEDGRVLWSIRQHPSMVGQINSADNPWFRAIDAWAEVLLDENRNPCPPLN